MVQDKESTITGSALLCRHFLVLWWERSTQPFYPTVLPNKGSAYQRTLRLLNKTFIAATIKLQILSGNKARLGTAKESASIAELFR